MLQRKAKPLQEDKPWLGCPEWLLRYWVGA